MAHLCEKITLESDCAEIVFYANFILGFLEFYNFKFIDTLKLYLQPNQQSDLVRTGLVRFDSDGAEFEFCATFVLVFASASTWLGRCTTNLL